MKTNAISCAGVVEVTSGRRRPVRALSVISANQETSVRDMIPPQYVGRHAHGDGKAEDAVRD